MNCCPRPSASGNSSSGHPQNLGVIVLTVTQEGTTFPKSGQTVVVHYTGKLENGTVFDSSRDRGQPFQFVLGKGQVIKGWEDCIPQMSLGQRVKLTCPSNLGYGKRGFPGVIPPDATLIFDIELIRIS